MQAPKIIKSRIASIKNTKQLTKAMEMISTVKMRRLLESMLENRPFAHKTWEMLSQVLVNLEVRHHRGVSEHALFRERSGDKFLVILLTDDRGLCGGFHAHLFAQLRRLLGSTKRAAASTFDFINVGKKGSQFLRQRELDTVLHYTMADFNQQVKDAAAAGDSPIKTIVDYLLTHYNAGTYSRVFLVHTDYVNTFEQVAQVRQLLPISWETIHQQFADQDFSSDLQLFALDGLVKQPQLSAEMNKSKQIINAGAGLQMTIDQVPEYKIEPDEFTIIDQLVPFCLEAQLYHAFLESQVSAEAARVVHMKNATTAAGDVQARLQLSYNRARQDRITQDITEISAGKSALEDN